MGCALERRVALDAKAFASLLAATGAIHISNQHLLGILVLLAERIPIRLHGLTVASPRRKELDESRLARREDELICVRCAVCSALSEVCYAKRAMPSMRGQTVRGLRMRGLA